MTMDPDSKKAQKKSKGHYKVVFKGRLRGGFSREQVIENISRLTKIPEQKIQQKFFSGKAVIIRRAHDQAHAQKLQQLFTQAGLEVIILKDQSIKKAEPKQTVKRGKKKKNHRSRSNKPILLILLMLIVFASGFYFWSQYHSQWEVPEQITGIEQSLANEQLIFLAYANYKRLSHLKDYFIDDPDALPGLESGLFDKLKKSGINPETTLSHVLLAIYPVDQQTVTQVFLLGQFPVVSVKKFLMNHYNGERIRGHQNRLRIAQINPVNCQQQAYKEVLIEPNRIIISTEGQLDNVLSLLQSSKGSQTNLSGWDKYRTDRLLAMALFNPKQSSRLTTGLLSVITKDIARKNTALDSLYAGLGVQLLPPVGELDIRLNSQDQQWLVDMQHEFLTQIQSMKQKSKGLVSVQTLLKKIMLQKDNDRLDVNLVLDSELKDSLTLSVNDFINRFFSVDIQQESGTGLAAQEKINTSPVQYLAQVDKNQIKHFNQQYDQFFKPVWTAGPFALAIEELTLKQEQIILHLRGKGQNIPNIGNKQARIHIIAVTDKQGKNVLADAGCNKAASVDDYFTRLGSARTAFINKKQVHYNELELRKKIRLKKGVSFAAVKALQAEIELNLATRTDVVRFAKPAENKALSRYGSRVLFKPSPDDVLSYSISGDEWRILSVRALNEKQQYLSIASTSSMTNLMGSGRSVTQNIHGKVAAVEIVYASEIEHLVYPVNITEFPPYATQEQWNYAIEKIKLSSLQSWNSKYQDLPALALDKQSSWYGLLMASRHDGPFNLGLYALKTSRHWGTSGRLLIKTPVIPELQHNLSALEVYFKYPQKDKQGEEGYSLFHLLEAKGYYMNGEFVLDKNKPYMDTLVDFKLPYKDEQKPLQLIEGELIIHLPLTRHNTTFTDLSIGAVWEDVGVKVKMVRLGNTVMGFDISGNRDRLLNISLLDKNNNRISTATIDYGFGSKADRERHRILLNYQGTPAKALLTVSEGQQLRRYPFKVELKNKSE